MASSPDGVEHHRRVGAVVASWDRAQVLALLARGDHCPVGPIEGVERHVERHHSYTRTTTTGTPMTTTGAPMTIFLVCIAVLERVEI